MKTASALGAPRGMERLLFRTVFVSRTSEDAFWGGRFSCSGMPKKL